MNDQNDKEMTVDEIISILSREINLTRLFIKYDIADVREIIEVRPNPPGEKRRGIRVSVQEVNKEYPTSIFIDLKKGMPTVEQVYDSLFGIGKDCDVKVIIYTSGYNSKDNNLPTADVNVVSDLIFHLRRREINTVLFEFDETQAGIEPIKLEEDRHGLWEDEFAIIPSKEQFFAEVFWAVYFSSNEGNCYDPTQAFNEIFRDTEDRGYHSYLGGGLPGDLEVFWDESGIRYRIKQLNDSDEYLKRALDAIGSNLEDRYGKDAIRFENVVGRLPRLYIKAFDRPFSWLYTATPAQMNKFSKELGMDVRMLCSLIENPECQTLEMNPA